MSRHANISAMVGWQFKAWSSTQERAVKCNGYMHWLKGREKFGLQTEQKRGYIYLEALD